VTKEKRLGRGLAALLGAPPDELQDGHSPLDAASARITPRRQTEKTEQTEQTEQTEKQAWSARRANLQTDRVDQTDQSAPSDDRDIVHLSVDEIDENPFQPRRDFSEPEIASLAESLKEHDMLQPILVRRVEGRYQLISGERRLRAAVQAGWSTVPARLREADDRLVAELAIVENLQRQDLNAIEKALSFKRYLDQHQCPQEDLAKRLKIDRSTIANLMRLLELPPIVQDALRCGSISAGHARAMLPLGDEPEQVAFCKRIQDEGMSVRETERLVQEIIRAEDAEPLGVVGQSAAKGQRTRNEQIASLEQQLRLALGTKTDIHQTSRGRGRIVIHFTSHEEFERIRTLLSDGGGLELHRRAG
jgi:ParB family chromosome partitioning protein